MSVNTKGTPTQLLQFYLPGLEMAANEILDQMNTILRTTGQTGEFQIVRANGLVDVNVNAHVKAIAEAPAPEPTTKKRMTDAGRQAVAAEAQRKRRDVERHRKLREQRRLETGKPVNSKHAEMGMGTNTRNTTEQDIIKWARKHHGVINLDGYKAAHPNEHCRVLAAMLNGGKVIKSNVPREYILTIPAPTSNGSAAAATANGATAE